MKCQNRKKYEMWKDEKITNKTKQIVEQEKKTTPQKMINAKFRLCFHIGMTMLNELKIANGWYSMKNLCWFLGQKMEQKQMAYCAQIIDSQDLWKLIQKTEGHNCVANHWCESLSQKKKKMDSCARLSSGN